MKSYLNDSSKYAYLTILHFSNCHAQVFPTMTPISLVGTVEWAQILSVVFTSVFAEHLLISPKDRFVAIAENLLWPLHFKRAIVAALTHINVAAVVFFPAPVLPIYAIAVPDAAAPFPIPLPAPAPAAGPNAAALFATSSSSSSGPAAPLASAAVTSPSCVVVDIGAYESRVLPLVHGAPQLQAYATAPVGTRHVAALLRALLLAPPGSAPALAAAAALDSTAPAPSEAQQLDAAASVVAPFLLPLAQPQQQQQQQGGDTTSSSVQSGAETDCPAIALAAVAAAWASAAVPVTTGSSANAGVNANTSSANVVRWSWLADVAPGTDLELAVATVAQADAAVAGAAAATVSPFPAQSALASDLRATFEDEDPSCLALAARALTQEVAEAVVLRIASHSAGLLVPDAVLTVTIPACFPLSPLGLTVTFPVRVYLTALHALFGFRYLPALAAAGAERTAPAAEPVAKGVTMTLTPVAAAFSNNNNKNSAAAAAGIVGENPSAVRSNTMATTASVESSASANAAAVAARAVSLAVCRGGASVADAVLDSLAALDAEARSLCARSLVLVGGGAGLAPWQPSAEATATICEAGAGAGATSLIPALLVNALAHAHAARGLGQPTVTTAAVERRRTQRQGKSDSSAAAKPHKSGFDGVLVSSVAQRAGDLRARLWQAPRPRLTSPITHPLIATWTGLSLMASMQLPPRVFIGLRAGAVPVEVDDIFGLDHEGEDDEHADGDDDDDEEATAAGIADGDNKDKKAASKRLDDADYGGDDDDDDDDDSEVGHALMAAKIADRTAKATARRLGPAAVAGRDWLWSHLALVARRQHEDRSYDDKVALAKKDAEIKRILKRQERAKAAEAAAKEMEIKATATAATRPAPK